MRRILVLVMLLVGVLAWTGWHSRDRLQAALTPTQTPAAQASPVRTPDVLYTWVDKDGVTHFEQAAKKGVRVEYDGSRLTPLPAVEAGQLARFEKAAAEVKGAAEPGLHQLRRELVQGAERMRESRAASSGDL